MSCPSCDKTMQLAAEDKNGVRLHWCPTCGTLRLTTPKGQVNDEVPALVGRCRKLEDKFRYADDPAFMNTLARLGVSEAINLPENRP